MTDEQALQILDVVQMRSNEIFDELRAQLTNKTTAPEVPGVGSPMAGDGQPWTLASEPLSGAWQEVDRVAGQSYTWPDGNVDLYTEFVVYEGSDEFKDMTLALGHKDNGEWIGFVLGKGDLASKRGIVYFQLADDFEESDELVSMIRGGGASGRSGFAPTDPPPAAYANFRIESLKSRKAGKWNVQAVVAASNEAETMLNHTAIQARLRSLA